jgi:hypothetical protein
MILKNQNKSATAIGRSKLVPTFLISEGARFKINFLLGIVIPTFLNVALILSLDSLIAASGSQIISIEGIELFASASTTISYP